MSWPEGLRDYIDGVRDEENPEVTLRPWPTLTSEQFEEALRALQPEGELPWVRYLDLRACKQIDNEAVFRIAERLKHLTYLDLGLCKQIDNEAVFRIAERLTDLTHLDLSVCEKIDNEAVFRIAERLTDLTHLDLSWCEQIDNQAVFRIAERLTDLTHLHLGWCKQIDNEAVFRIAERLTDLTHLDLSVCEKIDNEAVFRIAERLTDLTHLDLRWCKQIDNEAVFRIAERLTDLTHLDLGWCKQIDNEAVFRIAERLTDLTHLDLGLCKQIDNEAVFRIAERLTDLTHLDLSWCEQIDNEAVFRIAERLTDLTHLDLSVCYQIDNEAVFRIAERLTDLTHLDLSGCEKIDNEAVFRIAERLPPGAKIWTSGCGHTLPEALHQSTAGELLRYFRELGTETNAPVRAVKALLLGDGLVGKTSLRRSLCGEPHDPHLDRTASWEREALRIERVEPAVDAGEAAKAGGAGVEIALFDFGGQDQLHASHRLFFGDERNVYVVVVNAGWTRQQNALGHWLRCVRHFAGEAAPIVVVVTGCAAPPRKLEPPTLDCDWIQSQYGVSVAAVVEGFDSAAWDRNVDVQDHPVMNALRDVVAGKAGPASGRLAQVVHGVPYPGSTLRLRDWLERGERPTKGEGVDPERLADLPTFAEKGCVLYSGWFRDSAAACGIADDALELNLKLVHSLGVVFAPRLHPRIRTEALREQVLQPDWLRDRVYGLTGLGMAGQHGDNGFITARALRNRIWAQESPQQRDWLREIVSVDGLLIDVEEADPVSGRTVSGHFVLDWVATAPPEMGLPADAVKQFTMTWPEDVFLPRHLLLRLVGEGRVTLKRRYREHLYRNRVTLIDERRPGLEVVLSMDNESRAVTLSGRSEGEQTDAVVDQLDGWLKSMVSDLERLSCRPATLGDDAIEGMVRTIGFGRGAGLGKASSEIEVTEDAELLFDFPKEPMGTIVVKVGGEEIASKCYCDERTGKPIQVYWTIRTLYENRKERKKLTSESLPEDTNEMRREVEESEGLRKNYFSSTSPGKGKGKTNAHRMKSDTEKELAQLLGDQKSRVVIQGDGKGGEYGTGYILVIT